MVDMSNCESTRPFIEPGSGNAPVLDYNLPQQSCISALGRIELDIPTSWFKDSASLEPEVNWWNIPRGDLDEIRDKLVTDVNNIRAGSIVDRRVADVVRSGEARTIAEREAVQQATVSTAAGVSQRARGPSVGARTATAQAVSAATAGSRSSLAPNVNSSRLNNSRSVSAGVEETAHAIADGFKPVVVDTLGGASTLEFIPKPLFPRPRLYLVEEYRICSFLADYGAGKTLGAVALFPGEEREITMRSYRDSESSRVASENILDSFSQESADEFEELIESESGFATNSSSSQTTTTTGETGLSVGVDLFGLVEVGVGGEIESTGTKEASTAQETYVDTLSRALSKHVEQSSYTREVEVNTTTTDTVSEGEEKSVVRKVSNINRSRVLNLLFRQLMQEYITITYLHSVRVVYTNGYAETITPMELYAIDEVLPEYISEEHLDAVKAEILKPYCAVFNHRQQPKRFIERVERNIEKCEFVDANETKVFYRKNPKLQDEADGIKVPGVIKRVQRNVLRTPAVIVDALLSGGKAVDCYNETLQDAAAGRSLLNNEVTRVALDIVGSFDSPEDRARAYVSLLRDCECHPDEPDDDASDAGAESTDGDAGTTEE